MLCVSVSQTSVNPKLPEFLGSFPEPRDQNLQGGGRRQEALFFFLQTQRYALLGSVGNTSVSRALVQGVTDYSPSGHI